MNHANDCHLLLWNETCTCGVAPQPAPMTTEAKEAQRQNWAQGEAAMKESAQPAAHHRTWCASNFISSETRKRRDCNCVPAPEFLRDDEKRLRLTDESNFLLNRLREALAELEQANQVNAGLGLKLVPMNDRAHPYHQWRNVRAEKAEAALATAPHWEEVANMRAETIIELQSKLRESLEQAAQECEGFADGLPADSDAHLVRICVERIRAMKGAS